MMLQSPRGTKSTILQRRRLDSSGDGFDQWELMTTHFWGEFAAGNWTLVVSNENSLTFLKSWDLILHGTYERPHSHTPPRGAPPRVPRRTEDGMSVPGNNGSTTNPLVTSSLLLLLLILLILR